MTASKKKSEKCREWFRGHSIRWKLTVCLALFIGLSLVVMLLFQVYLLRFFHEQSKKQELSKAADLLAASIDGTNLEQLAYSCATESNVGVMIYRDAEPQAQLIVNVDATGKVATMLPDKYVSKLYDKASANGGTYFSKMTFGGFEVEDGDLLDFVKGDSGTGSNVLPEHLLMLYTKIVTSASGETYLLLLGSKVVPMESTVQSLRIEFAILSTIFLIAGALIVWVLYLNISRPLVRITETAKQLAQGDYNVRFAETGYRETVELAQILNDTSCELSKLDRLQQELIANISHDLRTPLTMIKGYAEVMRDIPGENTPENMQVLIDETARLSGLVNDLLDISKIKAQAQQAKPELFDLTQTVCDVLKRYEAFVKHHGFSIELQADCHVFVSANRGMLLQVLYNLINNAVNYSGEEKRVVVSQSIAEGRVRISVTDTGEGIAPEQMPYIWNRYYKVDKVHQRANIGTGLGLSIVKDVLEQHHAAYGVNSTLGKGSTFWFELPIEQKNNSLEDDT